MSAAYSSDEDTTINDAFGLSKLPVSKKPRTVQDKLAFQAAPHVLAEVSLPNTSLIHHVTHCAFRTL
jgi:pre-mRNA-processing factor 17